MLYRKLHRTWSHGYAHYIPDFQKVFPELKKLDSEELCRRFQELDIEFYTTKKTKISPWIRITLIPALVLWLLMFIGLPFNYIITGEWGYDLGKKNIIYNWFKSLSLNV